MDKLKDYPEFDKVREVVVEGLRVFPDREFENNPYENMRKQEITLQSVICKHAMDSWNNNRCFIFRESSLIDLDLMSKLNFNPSFWVFKWSDVFGRWCLDASNREDKRLSINGGAAKQLCIDHYGKVEYPEMVDIILSWMKYLKDNDRDWEHCYLFKEDIKSCFPQLNMAPSSALYLAMRIAIGVILINFAGTFGYTGLPAGWQVVGKALLWKARQLALSIIHLFADDFFGFGTIHEVEQDSEMVAKLIGDVMGESAKAPSKHELGQQIVIIGWYINLIDPRGASIRPKDEAIDKLVHMLFGFDEMVVQPKEMWESLAGLVQRMAFGCWGWMEHTLAFHGMVKKCRPTKKDVLKKRHYGGKSKTERATTSCRFSIEVLRAHLMLIWMDSDRFAIPLEQFVCLAGKSISPVGFVGISDACMNRVAVAIYSKSHHENKEPTTDLVAWMSVKFNYVYKKGYKHQCYVEYIGVILQYLLMNILYPLHPRKDKHPLVLQSRTDNMAAKAWLQKNTCVSLATQTACFAQTYMQINSKVDIASVVHHPGKEMKDIDIESRREEYLKENEFCSSLPPHLELDMDVYPIIRRFVELANPTKVEPCIQDMHYVYQTVAQEFGSFIHRSNPPPVVFKTPPSVYKLIKFNHNTKTRMSSQTLRFV